MSDTITLKIPVLILSMLVFMNFLYSSNAMAYDNTSNWNTLNVPGKFLYSTPMKADQIFVFQYRATNGILENFTANQLGSYTADVHSTLSTVFELKIPRNYPYSNVGRPIVSVSVNGNDLNQQQYSFLSDDCFFKFSIPFSGKANVTLSFTHLLAAEPFHGDSVPQYCMNETMVPEFPLAILVLMIGITLIIFYKTKNSRLYFST